MHCDSEGNTYKRKFFSEYFVSFNVVVIKLMSTAQRRNSISEIVRFICLFFDYK